MGNEVVRAFRIGWFNSFNCDWKDFGVKILGGGGEFIIVGGVGFEVSGQIAPLRLK